MCLTDRRIDLVVLDLDGTVLDPHSEAGMDLRVAEAIQAVRAQGVGVTLATGRTMEYVRERVRTLELDLPLITSQGAVLAELSGKVLREQFLADSVAAAVSDWARGLDRTVVMYFRRADGGLAIVQNREQFDASRYDHWFGGERVVTPQWAAYLLECKPLKFIVVNDQHTELDLVTPLQQRFGPQVQVVRTHPSLIEGTAHGVDKGSGLLHLLKILQVPATRVLVIGDQDNDLPMFAVAGLAVAMGQAEERVRLAADWVAPGVDEAGVAAALQRFILQPP